MGRLKALLTAEDMRTTSENLRPQESCSQPDRNQALSQRLQSCHSVFHLCHNQSQPNPVQPQLSQYHRQQSNQNQSQPAQAHSRSFQSHQSLLQEIQSKHIHSQQAQFHEAQSVPVQRRPVVPSMLEEAGQVLRQVRKHKKVLEENLEALLRANRGEVLHCQLEALAANRDWTSKVRIKKTVDAWISALTNDAQTDPSQRGAAVGSASSARRRPVSTFRGTGSKTAVGRGGRDPTAGLKVQGTEPDRGTDVIDSEQLDGESYLTHLYGKAPYEGLRRTLKKSPYLRFSSPASALGGKARPCLVERVRGVKVKSCKIQTERQHSFSSAHMTSSGAADPQSVPVAVPLGRRMVSSKCCYAPPSASVVATDDGAPEQQSQNGLDAGEAPPSHSVCIVVRKREEEDEDENGVFPGNDVESVAHVQVAVETDAGPCPPPVLYRGPPFPPQPPSVLPTPDSVPVLGLDRQRDVLENRLVEWMEQQLMSRMISEMHRPMDSDPAQNISPDSSESEERSFTSDIVEAAGGAGLQLFVDSSIEVNSALIRQLVSEVLTETVSLLLGQRDLRHTEPELGPAAAQEEKLVPLVPTPVPTPPPSPVQTTPLTTPPPSEPISQPNNASPQPVATCENIATPTSSPEPAPSAALYAPPPLTWGDAELPLDEEQPEAPLDQLSPPLMMSVAEEEPPLSSPHPSPLPSVPPTAPSSPPDPPSVSGSSEDSSSSSSSSSAVTEAALKHISEGELLISVNLQAALTEDEAACSFSSSLQDMDLDPPSEGQVRGQDLLLLTNMEQQLSHRGERPQPEGSWGREEEVSVGEVRDNWTTNPSKSTSAQQDETSSSSGQIDVSFEATSRGLVSMCDLTVEPLGMLTSDLRTELSLSPPPPHLENAHTAAQVKQINRRTERDLQPGGTRKMDVHLPFIRTEQEVEESVSGAQTSTTNDVF